MGVEVRVEMRVIAAGKAIAVAMPVAAGGTTRGTTTDDDGDDRADDEQLLVPMFRRNTDRNRAV